MCTGHVILNKLVYSSEMDLVFRDISVDIKGTPILQDVGAMVKHGAMLAILGPSGNMIILGLVLTWYFSFILGVV